ncbi:MAG TPA: hypothetical protein VN599_08905 [Rudaea sp.]|nr:hypothetical protein [Rudaea sp.]
MMHASKFNGVGGVLPGVWRAVLGLLLGVGAPLAALADQGDINYSSENWFDQIQYYSPIGQSFTAQAGALHAFSFWVLDCNSNQGGNTLTVTLYSGESTAPANQIAQATVTIPGTGTQDGFLDAIFDVPTVKGSLYTATISSPSARGCLRENYTEFTAVPPGPAYPNGQALVQGAFSAADDFPFLVQTGIIFADGFDGN